LEGANVDLESSINGSGMIDVVNRFMYTPVQIRITGSSNGSPVNTYTRIEMYVVNNTLYSKTGQMWIKQRLEEDSWSRTQLDQQSSIIKDAGVNLVGREEIRGEETYVLELSPNLKNLMDYAVEVNSKAQPTGTTNESVEEYAITEWISAKTFLPLKTVNTLTLLSENVTTTIEVTTEYYNYNKLVEDKLPYEAENAVEI
ncbi:MAG: DUF6612 family protein, partial [Candidatus Altiarchaeota archaeon]